MECFIKEIEKENLQSLGEPKEIVVDAIAWEENGHHGKTYSYHMSKERFERKVHSVFEIYVKPGMQENEEAKMTKICTIGYYDFVDYSYEDCVGERKLEMASKELGISLEKLQQLIRNPLEQLQQKIRNEFDATEEGRAKKEHEKVITTYKKAKRDFTMQLGFTGQAYDRCYNVFGQLMDGEYLGRLQAILEEREAEKKQSKKYRKQAYQKRFNEYNQASSSRPRYTEEEKEMFGKFYKVLAKKYHPDANPNLDTSMEMTLLNKIKKDYNL